MPDYIEIDCSTFKRPHYYYCPDDDTQVCFRCTHKETGLYEKAFALLSEFGRMEKEERIINGR